MSQTGENPPSRRPIPPGRAHEPQYPSQSYMYPPQQVVNVSVSPAKNPGTAALLAGLFGPLGMLYSTVPGALVMFCVNLLILVFGVLTFGAGLFLGIFSWIGGIIWAYQAANQESRPVASAQWHYPPQYPGYPGY